MIGLRSVIRRTLAATVLSTTALLGLLGGAGSVVAQTQTAVEYYYDVWNFYFVTSFPDEIAALDGGAFGGAWKRTGQTFNVWIGPTNGALPTCRFFSIAFAPKSSHFYTPFATECAFVQTNPAMQAAWQFEAIAFYIQLADANGLCSGGTIPLYRAYNDGMGGAPNHRYTTSLTILNQMLAAGWVFEGDGNTKVFACVPAGPVIPMPAEGFWDGTTDTNSTIDGVVLDDGTFYFFYAAADSSSGGLVQGTATAVNGQFASSNAKNFDLTGLGVTGVSIAGTYAPRTSLNGAITSAYGSATFAATYDSTYEQPASLSSVAGTYSGAAVSTSSSVRNTVVTLTATGAILGASPGCSFTGTAMPHGAVYVLDLSVTFLGGMCTYGTSTFTGVAFYDAPSGEIIAMAVNASRTDAFLFFGSK